MMPEYGLYQSRFSIATTELPLRLLCSDPTRPPFLTANIIVSKLRAVQRLLDQVGSSMDVSSS